MTPVNSLDDLASRLVGRLSRGPQGESRGQKAVGRPSAPPAQGAGRPRILPACQNGDRAMLPCVRAIAVPRENGSALPT